MSNYIKVDHTPKRVREFIADRIAQAIEESDVMNQSRLSITCEINGPLWKLWLSGEKVPSVYDLYKIALATGKPLEWFIAGADPDEESVIITTVKALRIEKSWSPDYNEDGTRKRGGRNGK